MTGVFLGHTLYFALKKAITGDASIKIGGEAQTGWWLGSAAFFSGTAWQPLVNMFQAAGTIDSPVEVGAPSLCLSLPVLALCLIL